MKLLTRYLVAIALALSLGSALAPRSSEAARNTGGGVPVDCERCYELWAFVVEWTAAYDALTCFCPKARYYMLSNIYRATKEFNDLGCKDAACPFV